MTAPFTYYYLYEFCALRPFTDLLHIFSKGYTADKISINHVTIFLSKHFSKCAIYMIFSPDVGNQSNPYIQRNKNK